MSTLSQLQTARTTAGAAYVTALAAFKTAYVNLAALDRTLSNANVGGGIQRSFQSDHDGIQRAVRIFGHSEYAPAVQDWEDQLLAASNTQIAAFTPG